MKTICSAIDKLDKNEWSIVKEEMLDKGVTSECADKIYKYTQINGKPEEVLSIIMKDDIIMNYSKAKEAINEFKYLLDFINSYDKTYLNYLIIDMSMVRGLDYYTGIILEAKFGNKEIASQYGSISGGGRYDELIGRFIPNESFPCVGASLGFERIFAYLKNKLGINSGSNTDILIVELSSKNDKENIFGLYKERLKLVKELRDNGFNCEFMAKIKPSFREQINYAENRDIKWMIIIGEDELKNNTVNLRRLMLINDIIITKDNKIGKIDKIEQIGNSKFPTFFVTSINDSNKQWKLNKKQINTVMCKGKKLEMQVKGLKRDNLQEFFKSNL